MPVESQYPEPKPVPSALVKIVAEYCPTYDYRAEGDAVIVRIGGILQLDNIVPASLAHVGGLCHDCQAPMLIVTEPV